MSAPAPPAFQFYPDDFLSGVVDMDCTERGCYITLLCYQWNRGSIPVEPKTLKIIVGGTKISAKVIEKFPISSCGLRKNLRLENERKKQDEYREKQRQKGILSGESRNRGSSAVALRFEPQGQPEGNSPPPPPSSSSIADKSATAVEAESPVPSGANPGEKRIPFLDAHRSAAFWDDAKRAYGQTTLGGLINVPLVDQAKFREILFSLPRPPRGIDPVDWGGWLLSAVIDGCQETMSLARDKKVRKPTGFAIGCIRNKIAILVSEFRPQNRSQA